MKNKEKFAKEIVEVAITGQSVAVSNNGRIGSFREIRCKDCKFANSEDCDVQLKEWAEQEYIEQKVFTEEEKAIFRALPNANWVARDMNGFVRIYKFKPTKRKCGWASDEQSFDVKTFSDAEFSAVKWEDSEPTSREEILK